jgi:hypothetical protein
MSVKRIERADGPRFQAYSRSGGRKVYVGTYMTLLEAHAALQEHLVMQAVWARGEALCKQNDAREIPIRNNKREWVVGAQTFATYEDAITAPSIRQEAARQMLSERLANATFDLAGQLSMFDDIACEPRGWTYVVAGPRLVKIGKTDDSLIARLSALASMSPEPLVLLALGSGSDLEIALHRKYAAMRHHGEWFEMDAARDLIAAYQGRPSGGCLRCAIDGSCARNANEEGSVYLR